MDEAAELFFRSLYLDAVADEANGHFACFVYIVVFGEIDAELATVVVIQRCVFTAHVRAAEVVQAYGDVLVDSAIAPFNEERTHEGCFIDGAQFKWLRVGGGGGNFDLVLLCGP